MSRTNEAEGQVSGFDDRRGDFDRSRQVREPSAREPSCRVPRSEVLNSKIHMTDHNIKPAAARFKKACCCLTPSGSELFSRYTCVPTTTASPVPKAHDFISSNYIK